MSIEFTTQSLALDGPGAPVVLVELQHDLPVVGSDFFIVQFVRGLTAPDSVIVVRDALRFPLAMIDQSAAYKLLAFKISSDGIADGVWWVDDYVYDPDQTAIEFTSSISGEAPVIPSDDVPVDDTPVNTFAAPVLLPLVNSGTISGFEHEFKSLVIDLYADLLAAADSDINMLGMPHLGSTELVRREMDADGLNLLRSDGDEGRARYLYRAWKGRNRNGRGLHFLKLYLRLLYSESASVRQVLKSAITDDEDGLRTDWYKPRLDDPDLKLDGTWRLDDVVPWRTDDVIFNPDEIYPSNRIRIELDYQSVDTSTYSGLVDVVSRIIPVRLVPEINLTSRASAFALTGCE